MKTCAECRFRPIPQGREKFCSAECAARHKRRKTRQARAGQHRHEAICRTCGKRLRLGRKRVPDEAQKPREDAAV